ncbi:MAG: hypothetical protein ACOYLF_02075 [Blastocatellia bacterium]
MRYLFKCQLAHQAGRPSTSTRYPPGSTRHSASRGNFQPRNLERQVAPLFRLRK